ncbi:MAG: phosphate ABC transporter ATP-binding protein [Gemmatimonadaceae bacterium]|nr:phosphate ABC transporter ATP-binding protein [Gemmatimonadaceae bacterium]
MTASPTGDEGEVRFADFSVWFGKLRALRDISLSVSRGQIVSVIGPSGCGKTTLLRSINRLNDSVPDTSHTGQLFVGTQDVYASASTSGLRQHVGMVFQQSTPFPRSIFANVAYGPQLNRAMKGTALDDVVEQSLQRASLWDEVADRLDDSALALSIGQQQRLCIARALANRPEVLLLDEPTSALDPSATQRIEELLYELRRDLSIILVTHNLHQAARVSDRTVFLFDGRLIESGETRALFTSPRATQTEAFITGRLG